jgi:hypothetical protein
MLAGRSVGGWTAGALLVGAALALGAGCGPIEYISTVTFDASHAVAEARAAHADRYAPYEFTAAGEYLHKARELVGYSRYEEAIDYGRKATTLGNQALDIARKKAGLPEESKSE